jgi:hypothetical protein
MDRQDDLGDSDVQRIQDMHRVAPAVMTDEDGEAAVVARMSVLACA